MTGDGDRLAQVFTNLVDNALKFTPPGGQVMVRAFAKDGWAQVEVCDSGKGIAIEDRERIFERFYQTDKSRRKGTDRGSGLGLPIARQIVLAHGGKIWADGQPGQGARFVVQLPLNKQSNEIVSAQRK
jgi:signal transduction histidine kinase